MSTKIINILSIVSLVFLSSFGAYKASYFLAEHYFFDKFFYQKSIDHGYWKPHDENRQIYGLRSLDLVNLSTQKTLVKGDPSAFKIAIYGDSFVWGVGLNNRQRFAYLLNKKLNKIRPTEVFSFAEPGFNNLQFDQFYQQVSKYLSADLNIFVPVNNDAYLQAYRSDNSKTISNCQDKFPNLSGVYDPFDYLFEKFGQNIDYTNPQTISFLDNSFQQSWINPINLCIVKSALNSLPTQNSIYFIADKYTEDNLNYNEYINLLNLERKFILSAEIGYSIPKYQKFWKTIPESYFRISSHEHHPNFLANQMYADILFNEITSNPRWNFIKN